MFIKLTKGDLNRLLIIFVDISLNSAKFFTLLNLFLLLLAEDIALKDNFNLEISEQVKMKKRNLKKFIGTGLACANMILSSSILNAEDKNNDSRKLPEINLRYNVDRIEYADEKHEELRDALYYNFNKNFSPRRTITLESLKINMKIEDYIDATDRLAKRSLTYGLRDFLERSELGLEIENTKEQLEDKSRDKIAEFRINGTSNIRSIRLDRGLRIEIPNSYYYFGTSFANNGQRDLARVELRAHYDLLDLRFSVPDINHWRLIAGVKAEYDGLDNGGKKFLYSRIERGKGERYIGLEGRSGIINNGNNSFRNRDGKLDTQLLFVVRMGL